MKTLTRGCAFDSETKEWAVWMNKPSGLSISNRTLYHNTGECQLLNYKNRKGVDMLVLRGNLPSGGVRNLNEFLIQIRADFTKYINSKKKEVGLK